MIAFSRKNNIDEELLKVVENYNSFCKAELQRQKEREEYFPNLLKFIFFILVHAISKIFGWIKDMLNGPTAIQETKSADDKK